VRNRDFRLSGMTGGVSCCQRISTVEYVDNSKRRLRLYQSAVTPKRTEQNLGLFVLIGKYDGKVTNNTRAQLLPRMADRNVTWYVL